MTKPREREKCSQPLRGRNFIGAFEMVLGLGVFYVSHLRSFKFLEKKRYKYADWVLRVFFFFF